MVKRKVSILDKAAIALAEVAFFIETEGMPKTAKKFVADAFIFFESLSYDIAVHKLCMYQPWAKLNYRCVPYKKKYTIAYLNSEDEIVICEFVSSKLIHW